MKLGDFGIFVIFAAVYAAGTLGLPRITLMAYQVKIGEIPTAFVAIFGIPAVLGLTLGQFIANLGLEAQPLEMISPIISFVGLMIVYFARKSSVIGGCIAYVLITASWLTYVLPIVNGTSPALASYSAFAGQFIAIIIGYIAYVFAVKPMTHKTH